MDIMKSCVTHSGVGGLNQGGSCVCVWGGGGGGQWGLNYPGENNCSVLMIGPH